MLDDLGLIGRVALIVLFGASAAAKARSVTLSIFAASLSRFGVSASRRRPVARLVVALEAVLVVGLLIPMTSRPAAALAALLLAAFTAALLGRIRAGDHAPCNCFGASGGSLGPVSIVRNLVALALGVLAALARWPGWAEATPLFVAGVVVGIALVLADLIGALLSSPSELTHS